MYVSGFLIQSEPVELKCSKFLEANSYFNKANLIHFQLKKVSLINHQICFQIFQKSFYSRN